MWTFFPRWHTPGGVCFSASPRTVIAHRASKIFSAVKNSTGSQSIAFFGLFCIQVYEFVASSSFEAVGTVDCIGEVILERGEQERPEFTLEPVNAR